MQITFLLVTSNGKDDKAIQDNTTQKIRKISKKDSINTSVKPRCSRRISCVCFL
jgi:predicted secreted protein